jgi:hypothetical protein
MVKEICDTKTGLLGRECPCKSYVDDSEKSVYGNFYARLSLAADEGCENAKMVVDKKFMTIHCFARFQNL